MFTCAFGNALLWKTRMYAKVSKSDIWKMRCVCYPLGILLLLIFSGDKQQYKSLRCHETLFSRGKFVTLSFPQSMISHFATPLSSDSPFLHHFSPIAQWLPQTLQSFSSPHSISWRSAPRTSPPTFCFHTAFPRGDFCSNLLFCLVGCRLHVLELLKTAFSELSMLFLYC